MKKICLSSITIQNKIWVEKKADISVDLIYCEGFELD